MAEKKVLNSMVVLPKSGKGCKLIDLQEFSFPNNEGQVVSGIKGSFIPMDLSFGQIGFTGMDGSVTCEVLKSMQKDHVYNLGIDINIKGKASLVDIEEVI